MDICLVTHWISDHPDDREREKLSILKANKVAHKPQLPSPSFIARALQRLSVRHTIRVLDIRALTSKEALDQEKLHPLANLYLLKSSKPQALDIAYYAEQHGALVINSWLATLSCQDRMFMAQRVQETELPWPTTWNLTMLENLLIQSELVTEIGYPFIIKSRYCNDRQIIYKISTAEQLNLLTKEWGQEPIILQKYITNDGWDIKLWVINQKVFAVRFRSRLEANIPGEFFPLETKNIPRTWIDIALKIGCVFNLCVYGIDLVVNEQGPMIVDVNSFPSFRGALNADSVMVEFIEELEK
jgi:ribosomal protein S6--L-glutamate ligase